MIKTQGRGILGGVQGQVSFSLVSISLKRREGGRERMRMKNKTLSTMMTLSTQIILQRKKEAMSETSLSVIGFASTNGFYLTHIIYFT